MLAIRQAQAASTRGWAGPWSGKEEEQAADVGEANGVVLVVRRRYGSPLAHHDSFLGGQAFGERTVRFEARHARSQSSASDLSTPTADAAAASSVDSA